VSGPTTDEPTHYATGSRTPRNAYETTNVVCENWFRCGLCSEANFEGGFALAPLFDLLV